MILFTNMRVLIIILFLFLSAFCKANEIDKLQTLDDVNAFLNKVSHSNKTDDYFSNYQNDTTSKFNHTRFLKIDLNKDGLTDLIVNGKYLIVVTDNGNGAFDFHVIDQALFLEKYVLVNVDESRERPLIVIKKYIPKAATNDKKLAYDTLIVKFGGLVEFNNIPVKLRLSKLYFSASSCYGECPIFKLFIHSDGTAWYHAIKYNSKEGEFNGHINQTVMKELIDLLNYLDLRKLKDDYGVPIDAPGYYIELKYKGSKTKKIHWSDGGTFGLETLHNFLYHLSTNQTWSEDE